MLPGPDYLHACSVHVLTYHARYSLTVHAKYDVGVDMDAVGHGKRDSVCVAVAYIAAANAALQLAAGGCHAHIHAYIHISRSPADKQNSRFPGDDSSTR
jgi:hypothetical protein